MGVAVVLYATGDVTDEQFGQANLLMTVRCPFLLWNDDAFPKLLKRTDYPEARVKVSTGMKFYGHGYERGDWPRIYAAIRMMQVALRHCEIFYGGDTTDYGIPCTTEFLESVWDHWCGQNGDAYHNRRINL